MKNSSLLTTVATTCLLFTQLPGIQASPAEKKPQAARIAQMCQNREVRLMLLHELTNTPERKQEVAQVLQDKGYYVRYPTARATGAAEAQTVNRATNNL